ncbi:MAG: tetratricopeptide repeat protein [Cellvibrionaceae bacterium]
MNCINVRPMEKARYLPLIYSSLLALFLSACGSAPTQDDASGTINPNARTVDIPAAATSEYQDVLRAIDAKKWSRAQSLLESMQSKYPNLASVNTMLGWTYWQAGKTKQAETELQAVTQQKGLYKSDAFNYLAIIYREQGKFVKAEKLYQQALRTWPRDPVLHKNLGILYELYLGRLKDALSAYKQAQAINGNDKKLNGWIKDLERRT